VKKYKDRYTKDMVLKSAIDALAQQKREEEEAKKEAERKAKEPLRL
jgi:hypothetical protein